jgi:hypothetical protein
VPPVRAGADGFVDVRSVVADAIIDLAIDAEWVPAESLSAEDEDRVGVPQRIDLWSDVDREPADHGGDQQQADRYHHPSDARPAPAHRHRQPIPRYLSQRLPCAAFARRARSMAVPRFISASSWRRNRALAGTTCTPTASPAAFFAAAGRLIANVVHQVQIVPEGLPLPTGRMHANPTRQYIYIAVARIALDATQAGGCRTGRPVSDGTIAWLQRE